MLRLEIYCDEGEGSKVSEVLAKWGVQFYTEEVKGNDRRILKFTALVPDFVINDVADDLMRAIDLRKAHSSITWAPVRGKSVRYSSSVRTLEKYRRRWTLADIEGLIESANSGANIDPIQLTLGAVASIIALFGLINDSIVMIISAMLLSPILGPLYGFSLNIVMGKGRDALNAVYSMLKFLGIIFLSALLAAAVLKLLGAMPAEPTHEILVRGESGLVYILLAVILGYAGIVAIVSRVPEILAGVSIAAALVPPTTVVGISLAMGWWEVFEGSLVLTLENVLGLLLGSLLALYLLNVSPRSYYEKRAAKIYTRRTGAVLATMVILLALLELLSG
ncbi:TIGR00341 family protein [Thermococcus sp. MV11]|uniref:TIGR00341 family protein n=1 Tax=Thermococcus sp. MV11 TaxID=1638267 RepID=UPI00142F6C3D|nr:TIGR00341 family protein [Thermococcus sp. MV11]NJE03558.1 TIGR00341 family protein [Thermococcus sp. MV11]